MGMTDQLPPFLWPDSRTAPCLGAPGAAH